MNIWINTGKYMMANTEVTWLGGNSPTITAPAVAGTERCDLIYLNASNVASVQAGTATPYNPFVRAAKPTPPTAGYFPVAWVWTKNGQTTIEEDDIADARLSFGSAGSGSVAAHTIFSATHSDTLADTIVRGDIPYVNATPKLARLPLGGIADSVLTRNATDVAWSAGALSFGGAYTLTIPATGTVALGAGTLTATTTNDVTGAAHTHAITASADVSAGTSVLLKSASGALTLKTITVKDANPLFALQDTAGAGSTWGVQVSAGGWYFQRSAPLFAYFMTVNASMQVGLGGTAAQASTLGVAGNFSLGQNYVAIAAPANGMIVEGNFGLGTSAPTNVFSLGGNTARTIWMERHTTADNAGNALTVQAGGATAGATDKAGGDYLLYPGVSTGSAESGGKFYGCVAGASGTTDRTQTIAFQILGNKIAFYNGTPVVRGAALTTQLTTITHTAPGTPDYAIQNLTNVAPYGFVTQDEGNSMLSVIANLQTRVAELETRLGSATGVNLFA